MLSLQCFHEALHQGHAWDMERNNAVRLEHTHQIPPLIQMCLQHYDLTLSDLVFPGISASEH